MNSLQTTIDHAETSCRSRGAKLTNKRKQVLAGLLQSNKAMSAYELVDYCKDQFGETMPPMSVYRILDFLQDEHLVHKLKLANKYIACSHITCDHKHGISQFLICNSCQTVKEIMVSTSTINAFRRNIEDAGFDLVEPQMEINCVCHKCKNKTA